MLNACTIIACNYLPFARVLADSFLEHHPGATFTILLIDDERRALPTDDDRIDWRRLSDIGLDAKEISRLAGIYDVTELATAVKPVLLRRLLDEGRGEIVYLDPDIKVYESLQEVAGYAAAHGIVLTPHTLRPYPKDDRQIDGFFVLAAGVYNLGFIAVGSSARPFLDWWWDTTRREALIEPTKMMFTDQRWVDFVPSFFDHYILKDPGYNVAYWNLHGREFYTEGDRYLVNGLPLRFFHFSGFDVGKPWLLSKHQGERPRVLLSERPALASICREYRQSLEAAGINEGAKPPYGWSQLPSGIPLTTRMRRLYWSALVAAEQGKGVEPPSPFGEDDPEAFIDWLNAPAEGGPRRVSRFLYSIYRDRPDLQAHFPDIYGNDAAAYAAWIHHDGTRQEKIPEELLPSVEETPAPGPAPGALEEGLNVAGYFRAELGIGEAARQLMSAIEAARIPFSTTTYDATLNRQSHPFEDRSSSGVAYDINVLCVNADSTPRFARDVGPEFFAGRQTAGYWFWEIEEFPPPMHAAFEIVDEVWAATDFIADAVRRTGQKPVYTIPLPVPVPQYSGSITRARLGLPDRFTFLLIFDFLSVVERKNPHGLIEAFTRAFAPDEGPVLVLKSINGDLRLAELERLRAAAANRADVWILDTYYTAEEKNALLGACDCYVSLHRSEGLGLTMAEAMALAKPVIATGYSGNLHFMTAENSYLVDYTRVPVPSGCEPYPKTAFWAEPDLARAAAFMREVVEAPRLATERATRGQRDVLERHNVDASARILSARVEAIRRERRSRITSTGGGGVEQKAGAATPPAVRAEQLEALLPALAETAMLRLSAGGRALAGARMLAQRALFRVLRPLWFQQHQFHTHVVNALRLTAGALRTEQQEREAVDLRLRELTRRVLSARRELGRLNRTLHQMESHSAVREVEAQSVRLAALETLQAEAARRLDATESQLQSQTAQWATRLEAVSTASGAFQDNAARHLEGLTKAVQETEQSVVTLSHRLYAAPYMSDRRRFTIQDESGREQLGYREDGHRTQDAYLQFEEVFRGPEAVIKDRQRVYLPLLAGRSRVVDLGCGRGEMLDLLQSAGIVATGVDADPGMVRHCESKGHEVVHGDVVDFLRTCAPGSIDAFFSAQVIEHLPVSVLTEFLQLCRSRLRPGGMLIAETVNPHSLEAFKTFHTDLTHQHPIFPEVALTLCQSAGFEEARIMFPLGNGELEDDRRYQGEYAVVAVGCR